jgi:hypothetical protein
MGDLAKLLGVFLLSAVKFGIGGVPAAVFAGFPIFKALMVTISGGVFGTFIFAYFSEWINRKINQLYARKKNRKKFTYTNKTIVYVKRYFGLIGLTIITPLILSIPLGVFLAVRYYKDRQRVVIYMIISIVCWAVLLYYFYESFRSLF